MGVPREVLFWEAPPRRIGLDWPPSNASPTSIVKSYPSTGLPRPPNSLAPEDHLMVKEASPPEHASGVEKGSMYSILIILFTFFDFSI